MSFKKGTTQHSENHQHEIELVMFIRCEKPYLKPENVLKHFEMANTWMFAPDKN
ncbi:hypothetical protein EHP00_2275 [Ecytonucleospora hepatopenaei]|uniref:Uncharacterized protein n=1 Tax=Ecytonucleospora hepatopenaei TaxID=646526 RepID=A0A1W0E3K0_9MICR|nr:hypothetical protein EHP00_2275 [Ecytonucleospora hepatopenaei]